MKINVCSIGEAMIEISNVKNNLYNQSFAGDTLNFCNYLDKKIHTYDPIPDICFEGICSITDKESKPLYVDDDHLSDYANSEYLFPGFSSFLKKHKLL